MAKKKKEIVPIIKVRKGATLKEIYKRVREEFTAADLQKFTEIGPTVPAAQLLEELEAIHQAASTKRRKKK